MAITAGMVKELREKTGAGMMDCKKALTQCDGDMEKAVDLLREKGLASAAKKADRVAAEGLVAIANGADGSASIVEVNSETDFVAKNDEFKEFVAKVAEVALNTKAEDVEGLLANEYEAGQTVQDVLTAKIAKIGENLSVRRFEKHGKENTVVAGYIHGGGKIGVLVEFETTATYSQIEQMGRDVAMQVAAMNPKYVSEADVDPEYVEHEKKVLTQQALNEGKPAEIVEKMVVGRLKKELKQVCLLDQAFVKDGDLTVAKYIENTAKSLSTEIKVLSMVRFEVGEGIEKREENFAEEVAKQMGQ